MKKPDTCKLFGCTTKSCKRHGDAEEMLWRAIHKWELESKKDMKAKTYSGALSVASWLDVEWAALEFARRANLKKKRR